MLRQKITNNNTTDKEKTVKISPAGAHTSTIESFCTNIVTSPFYDYINDIITVVEEVSCFYVQFFLDTKTSSLWSEERWENTEANFFLEPLWRLAIGPYEYFFEKMFCFLLDLAKITAPILIPGVFIPALVVYKDWKMIYRVSISFSSHISALTKI